MRLSSRAAADRGWAQSSAAEERRWMRCLGMLRRGRLHRWEELGRRAAEVQEQCHPCSARLPCQFPLQAIYKAALVPSSSPGASELPPRRKENVREGARKEDNAADLWRPADL